MGDKIDCLYNPLTGMIGCVLLQAAYSLNTRVPHLFDTSEWELAPIEGQAVMSATEEQWKFIASLDRDERVTRFNQGAN